jgi:hypothetical protein
VVASVDQKTFKDTLRMIVGVLGVLGLDLGVVLVGHGVVPQTTRVSLGFLRSEGHRRLRVVMFRVLL